MRSLGSDAEVAHGDVYPPAVNRWVANNVGHNVKILDGTVTLRGMGIMSPLHQPEQFLFHTNRLNGCHPVSQLVDIRHSEATLKISVMMMMTATEVVQNRGIPVVPYVADDISESGLRALSLLKHCCNQCCFPSHCKTQKLFFAMQLFLFANDKKPCPNWSGFMQQVTRGQYSSAAVVQMMPLIDMNPESCIYSTMFFAINQAKKLSIPCQLPMHYI